MIRVYESEDITQNYVEYRPKFQDFVAEEIMKFYNENKSGDHEPQVMADVGCGSGQATAPFHKFFSRIVGIDVSPNQIKQARLINPYDHISYEVGTAEHLPLEDNTVDLLVSATACQRFDLPKFFAEAKRVLKSDGTVALMGYTVPTIVPVGIKDEALTEELSLKTSKLLEEYEMMCNDPKSNLHWNTKFKNIYDVIPAEKKVWITDDLLMEFEWSLTRLKGYLRSLASYHEYMKAKEKELNGKGGLEKYDRAELLGNFIKREWRMEEKLDREILMKVQFFVYAVLATRF